MHIGLMTWFQYYNYGTALQLIAMNKLLSSKNDNVSVINYKTRPIKTLKRKCIVSKIHSHISNKRNPKLSSSERDFEFEQFYKTYLNFTDECNVLSELEKLNHSMDCFVCGSDQIWNPAVFDSHYFLDFVFDNNRKIAYAPSMSLPKIDDPLIEKKMSVLVSSIDSLSVREEAGAKVLSKLINKQVKVVLDPTLLLKRDEWNEFLIDEEEKLNDDYILVYMLGNNTNHWKMIEKFSASLNIDIRIIPVYEKDLLRKGCIHSPIGPKRFINLIKHSKYVLTDSFHGTVFSIIYGKKFNTFERFSNRSQYNQNSRIYNILTMLELNARIIKDRINTSDIDYEKVYKLLNAEIVKSKEFLFNSIDRVRNYKCNSLNNIKALTKLCCGCGACAEVCKFAAISIKRSSDGFYESVVDNNLCTSCGVCQKVCPLINNKEAIPLNRGILYSFKNADSNELMNSSSGGAGFVLGKVGIHEGASVIGCVFDQIKQEAVHICITETDKLKDTQGSKYIQSRFFDVMHELSLKNNLYYIFGLPCQIAAAKKIHGNNAIYIELICHGVPTYNAYKKYKEYLRRVHKIEDPYINVIFRDKSKGWRERFIKVESKTKSVCTHQFKDPYFMIFESTLAFSKVCYECPFRNRSQADIRIGDYWGTKYLSDTTGMSMVLSLTEKGEKTIQFLKKYGVLETTDVKDMFRWQQIENAPTPLIRDEVLTKLKDDSTHIENVVLDYIMPLHKEKISNRKKEKMIKRIKKIIRGSKE